VGKSSFDRQETALATRTELPDHEDPTTLPASRRIQQQVEAPRQLVLPLDEFSVQTHGIPRPRRVFCNRNLKMSAISWVGFDMDYTLAIYDQPAMDQLSIEATVDKLILRGYPAFIKHMGLQPVSKYARETCEFANLYSKWRGANRFPYSHNWWNR
jgi:hypothetical protein